MTAPLSLMKVPFGGLPPVDFSLDVGIPSGQMKEVLHAQVRVVDEGALRKLEGDSFSKVVGVELNYADLQGGRSTEALHWNAAPKNGFSPRWEITTSNADPSAAAAGGRAGLELYLITDTAQRLPLQGPDNRLSARFQRMMTPPEYL
jgi:hypothetical protein